MRALGAFWLAFALALCAVAPAMAVPTVGGCQVFPDATSSNRGTQADWNRDISQAPVDPRSASYIRSIGPGKHAHAGFGSERIYGFPLTIVPANQAPSRVVFTAYGHASDPGPYPIPPWAPLEGNSDRHALVLQRGSCKLYEMYDASYDRGAGHWYAGSGAVFNLRTGARRREGWTSADAAGLPILPGLARYDEVAAGAIRHALRFEVDQTQRAYVHPATHVASHSADSSLPPMGLRLRLKSSYDVSSFPPQARVVLTALKRYGMIVADNGTSWSISGQTDPRWNDDDLHSLSEVPGSAFEVVATGQSLMGH